MAAKTSNDMFYKQIILNRGIPFEVKIPAKQAFADIRRDYKV